MSTTDTLVLEPGREARYVPEYRLTRRGRIVVLVVGVLLAIAVGVVFAGGSVRTRRPGCTSSGRATRSGTSRPSSPPTPGRATPAT